MIAFARLCQTPSKKTKTNEWLTNEESISNKKLRVVDFDLVLNVEDRGGRFNLISSPTSKVSACVRGRRSPRNDFIDTRTSFLSRLIIVSNFSIEAYSSLNASAALMDAELT